MDRRELVGDSRLSETWTNVFSKEEPTHNRIWWDNAWSKGFIHPIEGPFSLMCQSKDITQKPIERHCWHANRKTLLYHSKNFIFLLASVSNHPCKRNLGKHGRENFGVQQLPLFNLLKLEDLDWLVYLSWSEGGRGLNTRVPKNLHSHEVTLMVDDVGNGLTYAIWRDDE